MIINRLKQYIDLKGINVSFFEKSIGMSNNSFRKSLKNNGSIGTDKLENILNIYSDINPNWLLTGEGDILKETCDILGEPQADYQNNNTDQNESEHDLTTTNLKGNKMINRVLAIIENKDKQLNEMFNQQKELIDQQKKLVDDNNKQQEKLIEQQNKLIEIISNLSKSTNDGDSTSKKNKKAG